MPKRTAWLAGSDLLTGNQGPKSRASPRHRHHLAPPQTATRPQVSGSLAGFVQWGRLATGIPSSSTLHSLSRSFPLYRRDPFSFRLRLVRCKGFLLFVSTAMSLLDSSLRKAGFTLSTQILQTCVRGRLGAGLLGDCSVCGAGGARPSASVAGPEQGGWRASAAQGVSQRRRAGIRWQGAHGSGAATRSPVPGASPPGAGPAARWARGLP